MPYRRNLGEHAEEIADFVDKNPMDTRGTSRNVSNEPRVPKGHGDQSGQWTTGDAAAQRATVKIPHPDGTTEIRSGGTAAWRNNNPGNIAAGSWARRHGAIGSDGTWAIFPNEETGKAALEAELNGPDYRSLTIDDAVAKRTPGKDPRNNTPQTQKTVRDISGLPGDAILERLTDLEKQRLYVAIRRSEGWKPGSVRTTP